MIAVLAALAICQAPNLASDSRLSSPVVYRAGAVALSNALESIGDASKISLTVAKPFGEELIALRIDGSSLRELMTRLAARSRLEWRKTESGYELYQTDEQRKAAEAELAIERIGRLKELRSQQELKFKLPRPDFDLLAQRLAAERAEPLPDPNKDWKTYQARAQEMERLRNEGDPSQWFASGVMAALTDQQLAELLGAGSITLVVNPNRLQHRLPQQSQKDVEAWARHTGNFSDVRGSLRLRMVDGRRVKVTAAISADKSLGANEFWLDLNDPDLPRNMQEPKGTALDKDLEIEGYLGMRFGMPNSRMPSEKVMEQLAEAIVSPEKREPLSVMAGDGLVEIAEETGNNLIAILSDDMIALGSQTDLPKNGRKMLAQFCDDVRAVYAESEGWIEVSPAELALSRAKAFPRKYFRQVANATKGGKLLRLSDVARIVGECSDLQLEGRFFRDYLTQAAARQEFTLLDTWGDISALRFWNSLTADESTALMSGGVQIGRFNPNARKLLWRAASLGGTTIADGGPFNGVFRSPQGSDPTKVFPNGFPPGEMLEARVDTIDCVLSYFQPWKYRIPVSQSVEKFATFAEPNKADMNDVRLGTSHRMAVFIDKLGWWADFREDVYDFTRPAQRWADAPTAIKARYETAKKDAGNDRGIIIR
jgi:hypothetical protein